MKLKGILAGACSLAFALALVRCSSGDPVATQYKKNGGLTGATDTPSTDTGGNVDTTGGGDATAGGDDASLAAAGVQFYSSNGCQGCHGGSIDTIPVLFNGYVIDDPDYITTEYTREDLQTSHGIALEPAPDVAQQLAKAFQGPPP